MTNTTEIKLTENTLENIKKMAPRLTRKQQHVVFGMILGLVTQNEVDQKSRDDTQRILEKEAG